MENIRLDSASYSFTQEGNCNGTTSEYEEIHIDFESSLGIDADGGGFFVLRTEGWSVDGVEDLDVLFNRIRKILNVKENK